MTTFNLYIDEESSTAYVVPDGSPRPSEDSVFAYSVEDSPQESVARLIRVATRDYNVDTFVIPEGISHSLEYLSYP